MTIIAGFLDTRTQSYVCSVSAESTLSATFDDNALSLQLVTPIASLESWYVVERDGVIHFSSSLLALQPLLGSTLDPVAIHRYLCFSFVAGEAMPWRGVRRFAPGTTWQHHAGQWTLIEAHPWREQIDLALGDEVAASRAIEPILQDAVARGIGDAQHVALYLSGGLDSSIVGVLLKEQGVAVTAFSLDFGEASVEKAEAEQVAKHLGFPLVWVPVTAELIASRVDRLATALELPFGDPVTGPQYLLGEAVRDAGLSVVFNGEGGDQLFGGWTNKPMIAAQLFDTHGQSRESMYLRAYHRFWELTNELYTPEFRDRIGNAFDLTPLLAPYFMSDRAKSFLGHLRLADLELKGYQNIAPRMMNIARSLGLKLRAPLFDAVLTRVAFQLPAQMKLRGVVEKYILKWMFQMRLPDTILHRRKSGMCVPAIDWLFGDQHDALVSRLTDATVQKRGLLQQSYIAQLVSGQDEIHEVRRRRLGEKLWTLVMLEAWWRNLHEEPR